MGTLSNKYPNSTSVEDALDKGLAAYNQSEENKTDIEENLGTISINLFDKNNAIKGKFFKGTIGSEITQVENSDYICFTIDVEPNEMYICSGVSYATYITDENGIVLRVRGSAEQANYSFNTGNNAKKAYISFNTRNFEINNYMIVKGQELPTSYLPFGFIYSENMKKSLNEEIYRVGSDKEYATFTDCIRALRGNANKKTIYIDGGVYDIYQEMGGEDFVNSLTEGQKWKDISDIIPPNTHIVGLGYVLFTYYPTVYTTISAELVSPINITGGNVTLENINVIGNQCRYTIHDDGSGDNENVTHEYINCHFEKKGGGLVQTFGSGIGNKCNMIFKDCVIKSNREAFSVHNQWYATLSNIVFENCAVIGGTNAMRFGSLSSKDESMPISVNIFNSVISGTVKFNNEDGNASRTNPYKLTLVKSSTITVDSTAYETLQFEPEIIN